MSQKITILTVSDLHRSRILYDQLAKAVEELSPDIVAVLGDFLDAGSDETGKLSTIECAQHLANLPSGEIIFVRGNHEDSALWTFEAEWSNIGATAFRLLDGSTFVNGPLVILGFPCIGNYGDGLYSEVPVQPSKWLPKAVQPFGPAATTLWLMHEPIWGSELCAESGYMAGNIEWVAPVEHFRPLAVVFGHDHQTPIRKRRWYESMPDRTACINVGQTEEGPLHFCLFEFHFPQPTPCLPTRGKVTAFPYRTTLRLPLRS